MSAPQSITLAGNCPLEGSSTGQKMLPQKAKLGNPYRGMSHLKRLKKDGRIALLGLPDKGGEKETRGWMCAVAAEGGVFVLIPPLTYTVGRARCSAPAGGDHPAAVQREHRTYCVAALT